MEKVNFRAMILTVMLVLIAASSANGSTVLFEDNFNDGDANGWEEYDGVFSVVSEIYHIESTGSWNDARSAVIDSNWLDYFIDLDFNNLTTNNAACVLFRVQEVAPGTDAGRYYQLHIHPNKVGFAEIDYSGGYAKLLAEVPYTVSPQMWHHVQIRIKGTRATAYIDGEYVLSYDGFSKYTWGGIGLKIINGGVVQFDNIIITQPVLQSLEIIGVDECAENSQAQYKAIAHYDNNSTSDVTHSAVWSVEPNSNCSIDDGVLRTETIDLPEDVLISAVYSESDVNESAEKQVSIFAICPSGSALEFDGVDDYVHINNNNTLGITDEITISQWIMANEDGGENNARLVRKGDVYMTAFKRWSGISFEVKLTNNSWLKAVDPTTYPQRLGQWYHVVGTYKKGNCVKLYINGQLRDSSATNSLGINTDTAGLAVGGTGIHENFNGVIDEVYVYNRVLSINEIQALMHTKPSFDDPNLVVYWSFDEGNGQVAGDVKGNDGQLGSEAGTDDSDPNWVDSDAPVGICTLDGLVERNLNEILDRKLGILDELGILLGKEDALLGYMDDAFHSGQYDHLNKGDVVKAKQKIHSAIQHEEQAETAVDQSIDKLDDALNTLGLE